MPFELRPGHSPGTLRPVIAVSQLTRRFGSVVAVDSLTFEIARGEVVGFLGPNGAGKTTTLRMLAGYLPATSGSATVAGYDVLRQSMDVRRRIGYLPESVALYREHRVHEMLEFQARLHGLPRGVAKTRIPMVLERVGVKDRERDLIGNLSRGLRQRVGLAVALLPDPEVLILDEPTSGLDPIQRIEVRALIRELAARHTVILSSHILPEIEAVCPRVIVIHRGRIAADGTQGDLVKQLAQQSHVRIEAVIGGDVAAATRLLGSIAGVRAVEDRGRLGIHHQFDVICDEDLREDVGAIAQSRGWALRELSWRRPTLEQLFARIALGTHEPAAHGTHAAPSAAALGGATLPLAPEPAKPATAVAAPKVVYNLNPFDMGATRDLGRPKQTEPNASANSARSGAAGAASSNDPPAGACDPR